MEFKTDVSYLKNIKCQDVYTESQVDYVLPDYLADVRKILFTEATLRPSGRFAGGDAVEFSGVVVYNVVYLDSEGDISSVEFTSDYDYSVKCSCDSYSDSIADTRVSNYAVRLVGPRKMSAKVSLVGSVRLTENSSVSASGDAFGGEGEPQVNTGSVKIRQSRPSAIVEREYAESVARLDGAIVDEVRVIYSCAETMVDSVDSAEDSASIKGRLRMWAVVKNGDEPAYGVEKTVGFEENIDFESPTSSMSLIPEVTVSSVKTNVNADENGCEVVLSTILELCLIGEGNQDVELLLDGYLLDCPTDNEYDEFCYTGLVDVATVRESHNVEIERTALESEGLREIVFLTATPKIESVEQSLETATINGEIRYSGVVCESVQDKASYAGVKFTSPFSINVNINCQNVEKLHLEPSVHSSNVSWSIDADKVYASCTIDITVVASEEKVTQVLSSMTKCVGESYASEGTKITVYYPSSEESLFSVAKRFHTSMMKVAKDNEITESVFVAENPEGKLSGVKKLLIY